MRDIFDLAFGEGDSERRPLSAISVCLSHLSSQMKAAASIYRIVSAFRLVALIQQISESKIEIALDFSGSKMDHNFLGFLLGAIRNCTNLTSLDLSNSVLDDYDAKNIIFALRHRKTPI